MPKIYVQQTEERMAVHHVEEQVGGICILHISSITIDLDMHISHGGICIIMHISSPTLDLDIGERCICIYAYMHMHMQDGGICILYIAHFQHYA